MSTLSTPAVAARSNWRDAVARHQFLIVLAVLCVLPFVLPYKALALNVLIFGLFAVGFNLMFGYLGMLSFGHAALFGAGAYGAGIAIVRFGLPWPLAVALGTLLGGLTALAIGTLAARTRGIYFAMVTLALSQCVYYIAHQAVDWTGGENGLRGVNVPATSVLGVAIDFHNPTTKYFVVLGFVAVALYVLSRILGSPFGAVLEAIREREARAIACGYDARITKLVAFVISGLFCGLAGALYAIHLSVVPLETLHYETSGMVVMMTLLGGMGTFIGPFIGAFVYLVLKDVVTLWTEYWQFAVGLVFIVIVLRFPGGVLGTLLQKVRP